MRTRAQVRAAAGQAEGRLGRAPAGPVQGQHSLSLRAMLLLPSHSWELRGGSSAGSTEVMPCREQLAAEDAAFISIQAFPALLDLPQDLEVSAVSCGSRHTAVVTRECPAGQGTVPLKARALRGARAHQDSAPGSRDRTAGHRAHLVLSLLQEAGSSTPGAGVSGTSALGLHSLPRSSL